MQNTFSTIKDVDFLILVELDDHDLNKICHADKYIYALCQDDYLWKLKIEKILGINILPNHLNHQGKELYMNLLKHMHFYSLLSDDNLLLVYIANWAVVNNNPLIVKNLIKLNIFPDQISLNIAAFLGHIDVLLEILKYVEKRSPTKSVAMIKFMLKGIFPNDNGANLALLNNQYDIVELLNKYSIYPNNNHNLSKYLDYAMRYNNDKLYDLLNNII